MEAIITEISITSRLKEKRLIEACKRGDIRAQFRVYKLYYKPVYTRCLQIYHDPAIAEDIMHESFLKAFENLGSYNDTMNLPSWIINHIK